MQSEAAKSIINSLSSMKKDGLLDKRGTSSTYNNYIEDAAKVIEFNQIDVVKNDLLGFSLIEDSGFMYIEIHGNVLNSVLPFSFHKRNLICFQYVKKEIDYIFSNVTVAGDRRDRVYFTFSGLIGYLCRSVYPLNRDKDARVLQLFRTEVHYRKHSNDPNDRRKRK